MARKLVITPKDGPAIGDRVWFADRSNGRLTEHLATVERAHSPTSLRLKVRDQGEERTFDAVSPWKSDSLQGWWKA